jgi:hypothetical protein
MIELEHSPLGGSAAHRFITCEGSFLLQREEIQDGTFEPIESEYAKLGTGAHELGAICLVNETEPFEYLGEDFNGYLAGWPDGIELDAVQVYVNECRAILDAAAGRPREILIERTIHLPDIHPLFKGTVDFGVLTPRTLYLRDYKNGEGIGVAAPGNKQLLYYAALMIRENPHWQEIPRDMIVNLGIVQPNFYGIFEEVPPWETTVGFVLDWLDNELLPKMRSLSDRRSYEPEDFVLGEHCQFCPVMLGCPKMQAAYEHYVEATEDFVTMLTNEELSTLYGEREHVRRFMKTLEETVKARKLTGQNITTAKLVEPMTARVWKPGAAAALRAAFGDKAYKSAELLSPAGIEKLSSRGKEMALEWGYKPDAGRLTIAPLSDRRPEAKPVGNAAVFEKHAAAALQDF